MAGKACPTMSVAGLSTDPRLIVRRVIAYYDCATDTQSTLFFDNLKSLTRRIAQYGTNPEALAEAIKDDLQALITPFVDSIDLTAVPTDAPNGRFNIDVTGTYIYQKRRYDIAENISLGERNEST